MEIMESDYEELLANVLNEMNKTDLIKLCKVAKLQKYSKMDKPKAIESLISMAVNVLEDMDCYYMNTTIDLFEFTITSKYVKTATDEEIKQLVRDVICSVISGYVYGFIDVSDNPENLHDFSWGDSTELSFEYQEISHYGGRFGTNVEVSKEFGELIFSITFETVWCFDNKESDDILYETWSLTHFQEVCKFVGDLNKDTAEMKRDIKQLNKREINDYVKVFFTQPNNRYDY